MLKLARACYKTYRNASSDEPEVHRPRFYVVGIVSVLLGLLTSDGLGTSLALMGTPITVIAGFAFAALFSGNSVAIFGLPDPQDGEDFDDLRRLGRLDENQKLRTEYFLMICLAELALIAVMSADLKIPSLVVEIVKALTQGIAGVDLGEIAIRGLELREIKKLAYDLIAFGLRVAVMFIFVECLYTFKRLSESILAIIRIRKKYLENRLPK